MEIDGLLNEAKQDYETGKIKQAAQKYRMVLKTDPKNALAHQGLVRCLYRLGRYREATIECKRALELNPDLAIPHAVLGFIHCRQRQFREGETELRKALELDPALEEAYVALGAALIEQGKFGEAESTLKKSLELNPNRSITYYNLSLNYFRQGQYTDALREAFYAFRIGPSVRTGIGVLLTFLAYLAAEHRILFSLLLSFFLLLSFAISSLLTLPLFALISVYLAFGLWRALLRLRLWRALLRLRLWRALLRLRLWRALLRRFVPVAARVSLEHDLLLSVRAISRSRWDRLARNRFPLYQAILADGIPLTPTSV